jgi:hypothetical protein
MATRARKTARKKTSAAGRSSASLRNDSIPRALLAKELQKRINQLGLSRNDAAIAVGDAASQMSRLMMLLRLGSDVTVTIRHPAGKGKKRGTVRVRAG